MTVNKMISMKGKEKISMLTAYDYLTAKILDDAGIDVLLVGDSLGTAVMGYTTTLPVTLEDIIHHTKAVRNGAPSAFIVADMPLASYGVTIADSVKNAARLIQEGGANAVKLEGGVEFVDTIRAIAQVGIPVMGHIGLKPQSVYRYGYKIAGRNAHEVESLIADAKAIESAGAFSFVIEGTMEEAARMVTESVAIPTIGIGAGKFTDGQVLVITDMLGLDKDVDFKHNKKFANIGRAIKRAVKEYIREVKENQFPADEHAFK